MLDDKYCIEPDRPKEMIWCKKCLYPSSSATSLSFDEKGVCSGCQVSKEGETNVDWDRRWKLLQRLTDEYKNQDRSNYDCIIPVSGGKDSYFQIHIIKKVLGLNPLLVTYNANNYTKTGMENLVNMKEVFGVDHIFFTPSIDVLKKLNRMGMKMMGDMNWHAHAGINTYPIKVAVAQKVPLMIWGEHGRMEHGGMHSHNDMIEFTYRYRHEHQLRGYEWSDFVKRAKEFGETLSKEEMIPWMYPNDEEIEDIGVRGIYLSNYVKWDATRHTKMMIDLYGFKESDEPFERTFTKTSNLDDMHENGIHDYMKYIKFGYGRATDHACREIRKGRMSRKEAIPIVLKMDPIKSKDLYRWLDYVGWSEEEFDKIADTFRDPRVWWKDKNGNWKKDNIKN
ncbi:hypothetical protein M947_11115 [Sulfurimonas hongkongensis]|uniref:LPS biosynthesis protein n=1 Tax=Sulfurimonas hongkongensis TaxID=1172190 RepID=T0KCH3_9BACT|nr:N-acetyl sugar amidotransferase [Sulfurimonas hongkongensis]EQB34424.1 hypothetical protein M947_11115 [Sulfurimonas hongkongensis]